MNSNELERHASALAGLMAALCCSIVWLGAGISVLALQGGMA